MALKPWPLEKDFFLVKWVANVAKKTLAKTLPNRRYLAKFDSSTQVKRPPMRSLAFFEKISQHCKLNWQTWRVVPYRLQGKGYRLRGNKITKHLLFRYFWRSLLFIQLTLTQHRKLSAFRPRPFYRVMGKNFYMNFEKFSLPAGALFQNDIGYLAKNQL